MEPLGFFDPLGYIDSPEKVSAPGVFRGVGGGKGEREDDEGKEVLRGSRQEVYVYTVLYVYVFEMLNVVCSADVNIP
jgi:hypothetical protein